jgi:hypothetical protein
MANDSIIQTIKVVDDNLYFIAEKIRNLNHPVNVQEE